MLAGDGAQIDTTTAAGRLVFGIFAALAEFERELIRERTVAGLKAARARGRKGGRKFALSKVQVRLAQAAMAHRDTSVSALCREFRHQAGDALPVRRPAGPVARADPRRPERVAARRRRQPGGRGAPLDHRQDDPTLQRPVRQPAPRPIHALEEYPLRLLDLGRLNVLVEGRRRPVVGRDVVPFPARRRRPRSSTTGPRTR